MKKLHLIAYIVVGLLSISCEFTEEITLNHDGSGAYHFKVDMSAMMSMMEATQDSVQPKTFQKYDSIVHFKDLLEDKKEQISTMSEEDKQLVKSLEDMKMHIHMDEENKSFLMDMIFDFKNIAELTHMQDKIAKAQALQKNELSDKKDVQNNEVTYHYSPKLFRRQVKMFKLSKADQAIFDENMESYKMYLAGSMYKINYHFPQTIKEVSLTDAVISEDGKSVEYEIPMDSVFTNPRILDFEIKF